MSVEAAVRGRDDPATIADRAATVAAMFLDRVAASAEREAYRYPVGNQWQSVTWAETAERVRNLAAGLVSLGVEPEQRVAIASGTRFEWVLADLAVMCAGAATTTVYPSSTVDDVAYILADSQSRVVFVEDDEQLAKIRERRAELPELVTAVSFDAAAGGDVISLGELERRGRAHLADHPDTVDDRVAAIRPDSLATLIYTSGTTDRPKGVRLPHSAWTFEGAAIDAAGILTADDTQFLWLPLAHSFGKVLLCAQLQIGFPTAVDGRVDRIVPNLGVVRPTFMGAAPRIFEKAHGRIVTMAHDEGGAKAKIFDWAFSVGLRVSRLRQQGSSPGRLLSGQHRVADRLVFRKIRQRFGGRVRFFISGAAALDSAVAEWFHAAGVLILEGYGLTESSAGSCVNRPESYRFGTVGIPLGDTEFRVADDGEVLIRGAGVMAGYHNLPAQTAVALTSDGWLHTGDIGRIEAGGFVRITDRKKDLFKTSGGKYVAPAAIESRFKSLCPYVGEVLVHGEGRSYCTALVTLDPDALAGWAQRQGMGGQSYEDLVGSDEIRQLMQGYVDQLNSQVNRWETIKSFVILPRDLSVEEGEVTPSLKLRRKAVEDRYRAELDRLYP